MTYLKPLVIALTTLLLGVITGLWWLLTTEAGLSFALVQAEAISGHALTVKQAHGQLLGPLELGGIRIKTGQGIVMNMERLQLKLHGWSLLRQCLHVKNLVINGLTVTLPDPRHQEKPAEPDVWLKTPLTLILDHAYITRLKIIRPHQPLLKIPRVDLAAHWTHVGLTLKQMVLEGPKGQIRLSGQLTSDTCHQVHGSVVFNWHKDHKHVTATLNASHDGRQIKVDIAFKAPVAARMKLVMTPSGQWPWRVRLNLPAFDPRHLLDAYGLKMLSARLSAHGHRQSGTLTGTIGLNHNVLKLQPLRARFDLHHTTLQLMALHLTSPRFPGGHVNIRGMLRDQGHLTWDLTLHAKQFNPASLWSDWNGALNAELNTHGTLTPQGPDVSVILNKLKGQLRQHQLTGNGTLQLSPGKGLQGHLVIASSHGSRFQINTRADRHLELQCSLASLADWLPGSTGHLTGAFAIQGIWPSIGVHGQLNGQALHWQQLAAKNLSLNMTIPTIHPFTGRMVLHARGTQVGTLALQKLSVRAEGSSDRHQIRINAQGRPLRLQLALHGQLHDQTWQGALTQVDLKPKTLPNWHLQKAIPLTWYPGHFNLPWLCLVAGTPQLCTSINQDKTGAIDVRYHLKSLPLALVADMTGMHAWPVRIRGQLDGNGDLHRRADGMFTGQASLSSTRGSLSHPDLADQALLKYSALTLNTRLTPTSQHFRVHAIMNRHGRLDGQLNIHAPGKQLTGQLNVQLDQLDFVHLLTHQLAHVKGQLDGSFYLNGTWAKPLLDARARLSHFSAEIPALGLKPDHGQFMLRTSQTGQILMDGQLQSGSGTLIVSGSGRFSSGMPAVLKLKGHDLNAIDIPSARVMLSPELTVKHQATGIKVSGKVYVNRANVNVAKLPDYPINPISPDVVVVDQKQPGTVHAPWPISTSVTVNLGSQTHVIGWGLDGYLRGVLTIDSRPHHKTTARGEISVNGNYTAYGQRLLVRQGRLLFASTPLDNPGLNIKAIRRLNPAITLTSHQQVGLLVTGTARQPILNVFSNPVMASSNALAYLLTGKPLWQTSQKENTMINTAAKALGSATSNLLAKSIGHPLDLDIVVSSNDTLDGNAAFTVGKYFSPRLYLSYGIGLFKPGQVATLRFQLGHHWNFEAQSANEFNRASLNYQFEK